MHKGSETLSCALPPYNLGVECRLLIRQRACLSVVNAPPLEIQYHDVLGPPPNEVPFAPDLTSISPGYFEQIQRQRVATIALGTMVDVCHLFALPCWFGLRHLVKPTNHMRGATSTRCSMGQHKGATLQVDQVPMANLQHSPCCHVCSMHTCHASHAIVRAV